MMTTITTPHEEEYSDKSRIIGILINWGDKNEKLDSFVYVYSRNVYIVFNTIMDMNEYLLYGDNKVNRAYLAEDDFDKLYDSPMDGLFKDQLKWK